MKAARHAVTICCLLAPGWLVAQEEVEHLWAGFETVAEVEKWETLGTQFDRLWSALPWWNPPRTTTRATTPRTPSTATTPNDNGQTRHRTRRPPEARLSPLQTEAEIRGAVAKCTVALITGRRHGMSWRGWRPGLRRASVLGTVTARLRSAWSNRGALGK